MLGTPALKSTYDVIVVGAGIVGCACAEQCARAGLSVLVLDRGLIGGETTAAGMGHLLVLDDCPAQMALTVYGRRLWLERRAELPAEVEFDPCGTLWVAADEEEMQAVTRKVASYRRFGVQAEALDAMTLYEEEPHLRLGLAGALWIPDDAVLYPPNAARFLLQQAQRAGAQVRLGQAVTRIRDNGVVTMTQGEVYQAQYVINAAGCNAPILTPDIPVQPRKGHLVVTERYPGWVRHQLVELDYLKSTHSMTEDSVAFNIQPRKTGQLLIGSSRQFGDGSRAVDSQIVSRMLERVHQYMPGLNRLLALRTWVGFRPTTPDKRPLIGPSNSSDRIWLATGHEGLGITTALATGHLVAAGLTGQSPALPLGPYLPSRIQDVEAQHA